MEQIPKDINSLVSNSKIIWRKHALQRMFERDIKRHEVLETILNGKIIKNYRDDKPFPSFLIEGEDFTETFMLLLELI